MQIQSINSFKVSPNYNFKKQKDVSVSQNTQYSTNVLDALSFKGTYFRFSNDEMNCKKMLDSYGERFDDWDKKEIMFAVRKLITSDKKTKILKKVLKAHDGKYQYLDSLQIADALNFISKFNVDPDQQNGLANMLSWKDNEGLSLSGYNILDYIKWHSDPELVVMKIGMLESHLKKKKFNAHDRGQLIGNTINFITAADKNYLPLATKIAKVYSNPENAEYLLRWDMRQPAKNLDKYLDAILEK